jgi:hypothetical protein
MPLTRHVERHFTSGETVRDIVIGIGYSEGDRLIYAARIRGA